MTSEERKKLETLTRQARSLRDVWLREREEQRAIQLAENAEVRKRWTEFDSVPAHVTQTMKRDESTSAGTGY